MTIVHAMVDTASIDVELDTHQLKEAIVEVLDEALGKVPLADLVATLDTRVNDHSKVISRMDASFLELDKLLHEDIGKRLNEIGEAQGELFERVERLADDLRRVKLGEDSARYGAQSIAIKNLIRRVAELEAVHGTKCIRTECGSIADGVDGKCIYHSQDDLEAVE
jgi:hypothetical protein